MELLPWGFVAAVQSGDRERLRALFGQDSRGRPDEDADRLIAHFSARGADGDYEPDRLEQLLKIEEISVDDRPVIKLGEAPVESLSPGQRCTALIAIILTQGDWPLVIDQPEDNLDNTMVFEVVVDVLRQLKDKRQVILVL